MYIVKDSKYIHFNITLSGLAEPTDFYFLELGKKLGENCSWCIRSLLNNKWEFSGLKLSGVELSLV